MDRANIEEIVLAYLKEDLEIDGPIAMDSKLSQDIGLDSMDMVDVMVFVKKKFGITMMKSDMAKMTILSDVVDFIEDKIGSDNTPV